MLLLYLFFPCAILMAFQVDFTEQVKEGLVLGTVADVIVEAMLLFLGSFF